MITITQIHQSIIAHVMAHLANSTYARVEFSSTDIKEGFDRPSFFLDYGEIAKDKVNHSRIETTLPVIIYFFASNMNAPRFENLEVGQLVSEALLNPINIEGTLAEPDEIRSTVSDGVLQVSFSLCIYEVIEKTDNSEPMESLLMRGVYA